MYNTFHTRFIRIIFSVSAYLALAVSSTDAVAWGHEGHTAIGILAVEQLSPEALQQLENIVSPLTKQAIAQACNWPDVIRETGAGKWSSPLHYVNIPRGEETYVASRDCPVRSAHPATAEQPARHCLTESIKHFANGLGDPQASPPQRQQAFAWLCHLVGDLHQPLHVGFADDRGGNNIEVFFRDKTINLHHFWDHSLIGQKAGSWQYLAGELSVFPPAQAGSGWSPDMVDEWTNESHALTLRRAYPPTANIDENFVDQSWELAKQQITLAAYRLAWIINSELEPDNRP